MQYFNPFVLNTVASLKVPRDIEGKITERYYPRETKIGSRNRDSAVVNKTNKLVTLILN